MINPLRHTLADGASVLVRRAVPDDAPASLLHAEAISHESDYLSYGPGEFSYTETKERNALAEYDRADNRLFIVGIMDDALVSMLSFRAGRRPRNRHTGEFGLSVRRSYWGRGIASVMLDTLIDWAKTTPIVRKINLRVRTDNLRAISLYQRKGFVMEGTISRAVWLNGAFFDHHWMGLEL